MTPESPYGPGNEHIKIEVDRGRVTPAGTLDLSVTAVRVNGKSVKFEVLNDKIILDAPEFFKVESDA